MIELKNEDWRQFIEELANIAQWNVQNEIMLQLSYSICVFIWFMFILPISSSSLGWSQLAYRNLPVQLHDHWILLIIATWVNHFVSLPHQAVPLASTLPFAEGWYHRITGSDVLGWALLVYCIVIKANSPVFRDNASGSFFLRFATFDLALKCWQLLPDHLILFMLILLRLLGPDHLLQLIKLFCLFSQL